jgi:acetylglutamate kinase
MSADTPLCKIVESAFTVIGVSCSVQNHAEQEEQLKRIKEAKEQLKREMEERKSIESCMIRFIEEMRKAVEEPVYDSDDSDDSDVNSVV